MGLNPSEWKIFILFGHVFSSMPHWRSVGKSNFDRGLHNNIVDPKNDRNKNRINR